MKRMLPVLLTALLLVSVFAPVAVCAESATSGTCGEGINWSYSNYTLTISGEGEMADGSPWEAYKDRIETVILTGGITKIGEGAFENYEGAVRCANEHPGYTVYSPTGEPLYTSK